MNEMQTFNTVLQLKVMKLMENINKSPDPEYRKVMLEKAITQLREDNQHLMGEIHVKDVPLLMKFMESALEAGVLLAMVMHNKDTTVNEIQQVVEPSPTYIG